MPAPVHDGTITDLQGCDAVANRAMLAAEKFVTRCVNGPSPLEGAQVLGVEQVLPSGSRMDLVADWGRGDEVLDWKVKLSLYKRSGQTVEQALEMAFADYANDHQLLHYSWELYQFASAPYPSFYHIGLIILEPTFRIEVRSFPIVPETLEAWCQSAERIWAQMAAEDAGEARPWMAAAHSTRYGPCEYQKACFECHWDPALMSRDYVQVGMKEAA